MYNFWNEDSCEFIFNVSHQRELNEIIYVECILSMCIYYNYPVYVKSQVFTVLNELPF